MTLTCILAGVSALLAIGLLIVGFFRIAVNLDALVRCRTCILIGSVEVAGGAWIWLGLFTVLGGYL